MTSTGATSRAQGTQDAQAVVGELTSLAGEDVYVIRGVDHMPAFLMSIVSDSDHWMYVSSNGGLTAGRVEPERCLFPYETDDRLYRAAGSTGPFTLLRVAGPAGAPVVWEPFTERSHLSHVQRNLYKTTAGNSVVFEEIHDDLGLTFRYRWSTSNAYGFVRTSALIRHAGSDALSVEVLDGLLNITPANVPLALQQSSSTLVEAYRRNEVDPRTGLAIFSLESRITDRAEPAESLHATVAWATGLAKPKVLLSTSQIPAFRHGSSIESVHLSKGCRGHYLLNATVNFDDTPAPEWMIVADVHQSQVDIEQRRAQLLGQSDVAADVAEHVRYGNERLRALTDAADGNQASADRMATAHHYANTLFNVMRGGVFVENGAVPIRDFIRFLETRNRMVVHAHAAWLATLGERIPHQQLLNSVIERSDHDLERLCYEYLPITFSRRHGDPSRPWNKFEIRVRHDDGSRVLNYQGNWRDIFQNWEALCYSFPAYFESMVAKFVNASTVDGFNPYRVTRDGIDWEVPDPNDPWSNIGYWGDHQIVYLVRLLEGSDAFHPDALRGLLNRKVFSYADVPYRLRSYDAIVRNAKDTIEFDAERARAIDERTAIMGTDGKLLLNLDGQVQHVTLAEKLLVPLLARLGHLVLEGGIWMNTQRPEWNDANNALVGLGASMVTLAYLRRYLDFCERLFSSYGDHEFTVSAEVAEWLRDTLSILRADSDRLDGSGIDDQHRRRLLDALGTAFSHYRANVYADGFTGDAVVATVQIIDLCRSARAYADHGIRANRREDGLYHAYNLIHLEGGNRGLRVERLPEMLEGQVAAISSGVLTSADVLAVVDALFASQLYRNDQNSFMLYPARKLPSFLEKNIIGTVAVESNPLLRALVKAPDTSILEIDAFGTYRFASHITSPAKLEESLEHLSTKTDWTELVATHRSDVYDVFEEVFKHRSFTGRSGSMYKYEGLGSIYWHMVSKLLLAVQEAFWRARTAGEPSDVVESLANAYYRIRAGLSSDKSPLQYGAFPMDPYSHTPGHMGAQQPGMTGQVKEEILTRWGELGVRVHRGAVRFDPTLLRMREFLDREQSWRFCDATGSEQTMTLPPGSLGFTFCQVPVIYRLVDGSAQLTVTNADGSRSRIASRSLDRATSRALFERRKSVASIQVSIPSTTISRR